MAKITDLKEWKTKKAIEPPASDEEPTFPALDKFMQHSIPEGDEDAAITPLGVIMGALYSAGENDKDVTYDIADMGSKIEQALIQFMGDTGVKEIVLEDGQLDFLYDDELDDYNETQVEPEEEE